MSNPSKNSESVRGLPLSPSMRSLLGAIINIIDRRILAIEEARLWAEDEDPIMVPATCDACSGTGILLVEPASRAQSDTGTSPVPGESPSPVTSDTEQMMTYLGIARDVAVVATGDSQTAPSGSISTAPASGALATAASSSASATLLAPAPTTLPPTVDVGVVVPQPSVVIPGFHSLGEHTTPPAPEDAVFCVEADGPPFYTVTRGKRVGCFGGWDMVSPYVVKAGGVVYKKQPSLIVAYEAYVKAYNRGAVSYT